MPLPQLVVPPLNNYRVLYQRDGPHEGTITAFKVAPGDQWILSASHGPGRNLLVLTDVRQVRVHGLVDMGPIWATSIAWVDTKLFFMGCNNGDIYSCRLQTGGSFACFFQVNISPTSDNHDSCPGVTHPILGLSFNACRGWLAFVCGREVFILHGQDASRTGQSWTLVHRFVPFAHCGSHLTCLEFFGRSRFGLLVGGRAGLAAYSKAGEILLPIFSNYDYGIANIAISPNGWYLVTSTYCDAVVTWTLRDSGPIPHSASIIGLQASDLPPTSEFAIPVTVSPSDAVIAGASTGYLHFSCALTRSKCGRLCYGSRYEIRALAAQGKRLYAMALHRDTGIITIICYTQSKEDFRNRVEAAQDVSITVPPYTKSMHQLVYSQPAGTVSERQTMIIRTPHLQHLAIGFVFILCAVFVAAVRNNCIKSLSDGSEFPNSQGFVAYAGVCFIHFYVPRPFRVFATRLLTFMLCILDIIVTLCN